MAEYDIRCVPTVTDIFLFFLSEAECVCRSTTSKTYLIKPGQSKAAATWPVPQYSECGARTRETTMVEPNVQSPHAFPRGDHIIKYTFKFEGGVDVVCPVTIIVKGD